MGLQCCVGGVRVLVGVEIREQGAGSREHEGKGQLSPVETGASKGQRGLISRVLAPALKLWVRSQLDHVDPLQLRIETGDRQLLSGDIPQVQLTANQAVYQGIHLSAINVLGRHIRVNMGQVLKGHPLRLLTPIPVDLAVSLQLGDLQASLTSPLLQVAFSQVLQRVIGEHLATALGSAPGQDDWTLIQPQLGLAAHQLTFRSELSSTTTCRRVAVTLCTDLRIGQPCELVLHQPRWQLGCRDAPASPFQALPNHVFNLGEHVHLEELTIAPGEIVGRGRFTISP